MKFLKTNKYIDLINIFFLNIALTLLIPVEYSMWTDRDLFRAKINMFEPLGAELSFYTGDRIPGGLLNFLWGTILKIYDNPIAIYTFQLILTSLSLTFLYSIIKKKINIISSIIIILLLNLGISEYVGGIWNPSMAAPFFIFSFYFLLKGIWKDKKYIKISYFFIFCAMQMHLSCSLLLIIIIFYSILKKISLKDILYILLFFGLNYGIYITHEINNNFTNSNSLIYQLKTLIVNYKIILISLFSFFGFYFINTKKAIQICLIILSILSISILMSFSTKTNTTLENNILLTINKSNQIYHLCDSNKKFKCMDTNNDFSNLNMINLNSVKEIISNQLNSYNQDYTYVNIKNEWDNNDGKYSTLHMVVFLKDKKIIYTEDGYLRPLWNIENVKEIISISHINLKIHFIILIFTYLFFIFSFYSEKEFEDIYFISLCGLIINLLIFGGTFSFMLSDGHKRYLLLILINHILVIGLIINKIKIQFLLTVRIKYLILLFLLFFIAIIINKNNYIINKTEVLINKIANISKSNNYNIYNNLILINKNKEIVLTNRVVDYKYKKTLDDSNKCYIASQEKLEFNDIKNIYKQPYNICIGEECLTNGNKEKSLSFNGDNLGIKYSQIKIVKIRNFGYIKNKFNNNNYYIYETHFKNLLSCPTSYHNRYILSSNDKKEKNIYHSESNAINHTNNNNHFIFKNTINNDTFVYSLIINKKNSSFVISSNQLKGISYNYGFFNSYSMYNINLLINGKPIKVNSMLGINGNIKPIILWNPLISNLKQGDIIKISYQLNLISFFNNKLNNQNNIIFNNQVIYQ